MPVDIDLLQAVSRALSDVVAEPELWPAFLDQIAKACGGMGAMLLPQTGSQGVAASASAREGLETYIKEGWYEGDRDPRKRAIPLHLRGEVATDADIINSEEMRRSAMYNELLPRFDTKWWAGIGFKAGSERWCLALLRSERQGEFEPADKAILKEFSARLTEISKLSYVAGRAALSEVASSFDRLRQAVIAIDDKGRVIRTNASADRLFGESLRVSGGRLIISDSKAAAQYSKLLDSIRCAHEGKSLRAPNIVVGRRNAAPLLIEALPVDGAVKSPFLHACALLLLKTIGKPERPDWHLLRDTFGLTPAEARLAALLVTGESLEHIADELRITKETARYELKSVFRKTDVHRQSQLVALFAALLRSK